MKSYFSTQVNEEEGAYFAKKRIPVIDEKLNSQQIKDFVRFEVHLGNTAILEKKRQEERPKLLVEQYYKLPDPNTRIAGRFGFRSLNKWEGVVAEISENEFRAVLTDLIHGGPQEEVTFSLEEVSEQDLPLLKPGALFYWNIGYETINGQRRKASLIRFKRLPNWSQKDWDQILDKANELQQGLEWE